MASKLSDQLFSRLKQIECTDSTYPAKPPLVLDRAKGSYAYDVDGKKYLDFCTSFGSLGLGHNDPELKNTLQEFLNSNTQWQSMGDVYPHQNKIELLSWLHERLPKRFTRSSLSLTGSDAIQTAIKSIELATNCKGVLAIEHCYHGVEFGPMRITHRKDFKDRFVGQEEQSSVSYIKPHAPLENVNKAIQNLQGSDHGFAGMILEPVLGRGGLIPLDPSWVKKVSEVVKQAGGFLIFDEILCGLGRCGVFSFTEELPADLTCFGKNFGGGLPLSVCVGTEEVMKHWPVSSGEAIHTGTFFGHSMSCYVALANLKIHERDNLFTRANTGQEWFVSIIESCLADKKEFISEIRSCGFWINIVFKQAGFGAKMMDQCRENGLIALVCGGSAESLSLIPALNVTKTQARLAGEMISTSLDELTRREPEGAFES